jgi:hypothetical protein
MIVNGGKGKLPLKVISFDARIRMSAYVGNYG